MILHILCALAFSAKTVSVFYDLAANNFTISYDTFSREAAARAFLSDNATTVNGTRILKVEAGKLFNKLIESKAMGIAEAALTKDLFVNQYALQNKILCRRFLNCTGSALPSDLTDFFSQNLAWLRDYLSSSPITSIYTQLNLILAQFDGMASVLSISSAELWTYLSRSEILNIGRVLTAPNSQKYVVKSINDSVIDRSATSLVVLTQSLDDIILGHNSITSYSEETKLSKYYEDTDGQRLAFVGYPCELSSSDVFMITSNSLFALGTPLSISSTKIYSSNLYTQGIPSWFRAIVASKLTSTPDKWGEMYGLQPLYGAATEFIIVDLKRLEPEVRLKSGAVSVVDQILDNGEAVVDITETLYSNKFYESIGIPHISSEYTRAGYEELCANNAELCSNTSVRTKLISKYAPNVTNVDSMKKIIRLNLYQSEELQNGSAVVAISPRGDINGTCIGAVDAKASSLRMALHYKWSDAQGPTSDNVTAFSFSGSGCNDEPHEEDSIFNSWMDFTFALRRPSK